MPDAIASLQAAARMYGQLLGTTVTRIALYGEHGRIASVPVPPDLGSHLIPTPAPAPVAGWDFGEPVPRFDGRQISIHGRQKALLRVLAASTIPLTINDLRRKVWIDYQPETGTVRWFIGELRKSLRREFPDRLGDFISSGPEGYSLVVR